MANIDLKFMKMSKATAKEINSMGVPKKKKTTTKKVKKATKK